MKRFQNHRINRAITVFIGLIYGQLSFADGGLIPTINGAEKVAEGGDAMGVLAGWVKTGMFILLCASSIFLLTKAMNTAMVGLKKAQDDEGSITTMLNYLVSALLAATLGLVCAYIGYQVYQNFNVPG